MRFGSALGLQNGVAKRPVAGEGSQETQPAKIAYPGIADCAGDGGGKGGVCEKQPAPRGDSVGLVVETVGKHLGEVLDGRRAEQVRVNGGHAIGAVGADDSQVSHANLAVGTFLDEANVCGTLPVAGKASPDIVEESAIYLQNYFKLAREQSLKPFKGPLL